MPGTREEAALRTDPTRKRGAAKPERVFIVQEEYITLGQLLKAIGIISTGGAAKAYLEASAVQVNGEPEQRRGRKLRPGDVVVVPGGPTIRLRAGGSPPPASSSS